MNAWPTFPMIPDVTSLDQATAALTEGDLTGALVHLRSALETGMTARQIRDWFITLHGLYCLEECQLLAAKLLQVPDHRTQDLLACARLFFQSGRFDSAAELTRHALEADPENPDTIAQLASCHERAGDDSRAKILLANSSGHARSTRLLAHIFRKEGDFEKARSLLESHLENHPSDDDWRLRCELASVLDRQKHHPAAMATLLLAKRDLITRVPKDQATSLNARRWEVTQLLTADRLAQWSQSKSQLTPPQEICLLAGFPRSGTTLLENVLATHPGVIGTDESGVLYSQFESPFILSAASAEEALAELDDFEPDELSTGRADYLRCSAEHLGEAISSRLLIEKDPLLTSSLALPLRLFPDAKIIMPLRDPRDVVISYYFTIVPLAASSAAAIDLGETCRFYAETMRHWLFLKDRLPVSQWLESRYEDLLADPETHTRKLADFLELPWSEKMLAHHDHRGDKPVTTPTYHDVSAPLYTRALGRWRNYAAALQPHLHHLQPYLEAFGYSQDRVEILP